MENNTISQVSFDELHSDFSSDKIDVKDIPQYAKKLKVVSLFSGCGGLDLGFEGGFKVFAGKNEKTFDENPFEIIWANDFFKEAVDTYRTNIGDHIVQGDIGEIIENNIDEIPLGDIIIGGFPCQDFSISGKQSGFNSERGLLYLRMVELIKKQKPIAFAAENVKNILNPNLVDPKSGEPAIDTIVRDFENAGYDVSVELLYAPDYGVPQKRERVFIVGTKKELGVKFKFPKSHHPLMTTKEAIDDLWGKEDDCSIPNHNQMSLAKFKEPRRNGNQGNYQINANGPSQVIRAEHHGNIQGHYRTYNPEHPNDRTNWRRLTVREAARLQTFPDNFVISGSKTQAYKTVGNAVPPILGWYVARALYKSIFA